MIAGAIFLTIIYYDIKTVALPPIAILLIVFMSPLFITKKKFGVPFRKPENNRIAVVVFFLISILVYFRGGRILGNLGYPLSAWVFWMLFIIGISLILWTVGIFNLDTLGVRKPEKRPSQYVALFFSFFFIPAIITTAMFSSYLEVSDYIELFITTTAFPAIFEEIAYRGILLDRVSSHYKSRASGIMLVSLVFGLTHGLTNLPLSGDVFASILISIVSQTVGGIAFGLLYYYSDSIIPGIFIHYLHNMIVGLNTHSQIGLFWSQFFFQLVVVMAVIAMVSSLYRIFRT